MINLQINALHSRTFLTNLKLSAFNIFLSLLKKMRTFPGFFSLTARGLEKKNPGIDDADLIRGFLNGDQRDFDTLVIRYRDMIFNLCLNIMGDYDEAVDCSQEVFIKMYHNLHRFGFRSALSTWLYSIALNTCRNRLSSSYRKKRVSIDGFENIHRAERSAEPEFLFERSESEKAVRKAIAMLPEEEKILIILRDLENRSYEEITVITGIKSGTVKSRLSRGRHRLRGLLQEVML